MRPPICFICGTRFSPREGGGTVRFTDYEPLPEGMTGHPEGLEWFCEEHHKEALELTEHTSAQARKIQSGRPM